MPMPAGYVTKAALRSAADALIYDYIAHGGKVTICPPAKAHGA